MKILSVILSCQKERKLWPNWRKEHAVIICGNPQLKENFELKENILFVKGPDRYDLLPFKMKSLSWQHLHITLDPALKGRNYDLYLIFIILF